MTTSDSTPTPNTQDPTPAEPRRALVMVAHPDDAEFMCGGTVAKLCADGWEVWYCLATSGDKGTKDPEMTRERLAGMREEEQRAACRILGAKDVIFLRRPDGFLENTHEFRGEIVRLLRQLRPHLVITWDGFRRGFNHNDHRVVGVATYDAVFPASRDPLYYPEQIEEGLNWHRVGELLLAGSDEPDYFIDISEVYEKKIEALLAHTSQVARDTPRDDWVKMMRQRTREAAEITGIPYAEAFRRITLRT
ncbi:MAG: PIG-L family deacetylase [Chloroflexi bacterium]|nr:PIG-L family deacetylase [Chloroflexota bacterium]